MTGDKQYAVDLVDLDQLDLHTFAVSGREVLADVVGPDRELAVAAIGEHGELHPVGTAELEQTVDRRANRPAGVEDVVDEDHRAALELEVELRVAHDGLCVPRRPAGANVDVVAVKGDVQLAEREQLSRALFDEAAQAMRERNAARVDTDECHRAEVLVALDDLVRDAGERPADRLVVEQIFDAGLTAG